MEKFLSKHAFWVVQFISWTLFWAWNLYASDFQRTPGESVYYMVVWISESIITTSFLRWMLKKMNFEIATFKFANILKFLASFITSVLVFTILGEISPFIRKFFFEPLTNGEPRDLLISFTYYGFIVAVWTICYLTILLFRKLNRQRIERLEISASLKQAQLNALRGQMNLTFLINCLNNIKTLSQKDVYSARNLLTMLSDLLRYSLTNIDVNMVLLSEELNMVDHYVALLNIQASNRIEFDKQVVLETSVSQIPPMVLLSLVEHTNNAVMSLSKENKKMNLEIFVEKENIMIKLTTIGKFSNVSGDLDKRLQELSKRLRILYGSQGNLTINGQNNYISSKIEIPVLSKSPNEATE